MTLTNATTKKSYISPAEILDRIREFGTEASYVATHIVRIDEQTYERLKVLYHYLARGTDFRVDSDTSTVLVDDKRKDWSCLNSIASLHG